MSDSQLAASVLALFDGTADTFLVCAGAGAVVSQKTASQAKTLLAITNSDVSGLGSLATQSITFGAGVAALLAGPSSGTGGPAGTVSPTFTGTVTTAAITASGVITASSNSAHTFGTAGTQVSLAAGVVTLAGSGLTRTLTATPTGVASSRGFQCDNGSVYFLQPTTGLLMTSGTGARAGTATLVAGTVTVTNTSVTASTRIFLTVRTPGGTLGTLSYTLSAGASFTINSSSASDTSIVTYFLIEVI